MMITSPIRTRCGWSQVSYLVPAGDHECWQSQTNSGPGMDHHMCTSTCWWSRVHWGSADNHNCIQDPCSRQQLADDLKCIYAYVIIQDLLSINNALGTSWRQGNPSCEIRSGWEDVEGDQSRESPSFGVSCCCHWSWGHHHRLGSQTAFSERAPAGIRREALLGEAMRVICPISSPFDWHQGTLLRLWNLHQLKSSWTSMPWYYITGLWCRGVYYRTLKPWYMYLYYTEPQIFRTVSVDVRQKTLNSN